MSPRVGVRFADRQFVAVAAVWCALALAFVAPTPASARETILGVSVRHSAAPREETLVDSLRGKSGRLRARFIAPVRAASIPILRQLFGDRAEHKAGVYASADAGGLFQFITMRPFADKVRGRIGAYRIGFFPNERKSVRSVAYANPEGFVEVTSANRETAVSEHFRLGDFLTHDQGDVWPKYLVLREPLIDKLELVIDELRAMGVQVGRLAVMSGFRTPQYNAKGVGAGGRVQDSRHQYGDAADVYVATGSRDWMTDLNGDGRVDTADAQILADAAERVERAHPDLVGGIGIYRGTAAHGPFVHIDVRGTRARWSNL